MMPKCCWAIHVVIDQLALNLIDIGLDNPLQILYKSFALLSKLGKIDCSKVTKIWLVKFCMVNFKIVYLTQFSTDFNNLGFKIKQKTFVLLFIKRQKCFSGHPVHIQVTTYELIQTC